jgi:hypothetical protein
VLLDRRVAAALLASWLTLVAFLLGVPRLPVTVLQVTGVVDRSAPACVSCSRAHRPGEFAIGLTCWPPGGAPACGSLLSGSAAGPYPLGLPAGRCRPRTSLAHHANWCASPPGPARFVSLLCWPCALWQKSATVAHGQQRSLAMAWGIAG